MKAAVGEKSVPRKSWTSKDLDETTAKALHGWSIAQQKILAGQYDLIVLDEFTYLMSLGWLETGVVIDWLKQHKPPALHLIITGRDAPAELREYADLVTEMVKHKHPYDVGIQAQPGIEF